jgi:tyrosine-protein kinase Etk/Wzc
MGIDHFSYINNSGYHDLHDHPAKLEFTFMENRKSAQQIDVKYLVQVILRHWLLLLFSVLVCSAVAIVYLKVASKTYLAGITVLLDVEERRAARGGSSEYFDVNEMMFQNKSLRNELAYLQSTPLVREVVEDMNLTVSYFMQEGRVPIPKDLIFTLSNIYKQSPFMVIIDESHPQPLNALFGISIFDDETFGIAAIEEPAVIYDFTRGNVVRSGVLININSRYRFGESVEGEHFSFKVLLNSNYNPEAYQGKQLFFSLSSPQQLTERFRSALSVRVNERESNIVDLSLQWGNAGIATDFLTNLINKYIEKDIQSKNRLANNTIEFIDQQLSNISGSLGRSEQQLQNFRSSFDVMNIDEKTRTLSTQIFDTERRLDQIESNYQTLQQINEYFEENKDVVNFVAPSLLGLEDEVLGSLIQEMAELATERMDLINRNQLKSPRLKTLNQNIDNIKRVITESLNLRIRRAENELGRAEEELANLQREYSRLPQTQRRLTGLEREFSITDAAYTALLDKRIEAQIARVSSESDCKIIEPVRFLGITAPSPMKTMALAIMLGLLFPLLYILARIFLTDRISNVDEIQSLTHLKQVGVIPLTDSREENVVIHEPHTPISEAFHRAKSSLVYYLLGETHKVILVTSSVPDEGKSFTSLNLATSFASTYNNTVLISFDLRKGNGAFAELRTESQPGISSYLINRAALDEIILKTDIPNLDYIDSGEIPPDPVALISSPKTEELFRQLKQQYDYIVVDTPPYDVVTDAFLLMKYAEIKLFVTRIGTITRKALRNCLNDFIVKEIDNIYMVLNGVKNMNSSKYAYYYHKTQSKRNIFHRIFRRK